MTHTITLAHHDLSLTIAPQMGGSVLGFTKNGQDILRPAHSATDPLASAGFPLVPFAGRITNGRFDFQNNTYSLAPNMLPEPHAIHGEGWRRPWRIDRLTQNSATISYHHQADNWPWRFTAQQIFTLHDNKLKLALSITNNDTTDMPAGLGWHPYFPNTDSALQTDIPGFKAGKNMAAQDIDAVMAWPSRSATLQVNGQQVMLTATDSFTHLTVYAPLGAHFFCAEPWSHHPDALNKGSTVSAGAQTPEMAGMKILPPGQSLSGVITLSIMA